MNSVHLVTQEQYWVQKLSQSESGAPNTQTGPTDPASTPSLRIGTPRPCPWSRAQRRATYACYPPTPSGPTCRAPRALCASALTCASARACACLCAPSTQRPPAHPRLHACAVSWAWLRVMSRYSPQPAPLSHDTTYHLAIQPSQQTTSVTIQLVYCDTLQPNSLLQYNPFPLQYTGCPIIQFSPML